MTAAAPRAILGCLVSVMVGIGTACSDDGGGFSKDPLVFRIVLLPDTQCYSLYSPEILESQGRWIADNAFAADIRLVMHLGDITENNDEVQWQRARESYAPLLDAVPLLLIPGNHDFGHGGSADQRTSLLGDYFPLDAQMRGAGFGGALDAWNGYRLVNGRNHSLVAIGLEFAPREEAVVWARGVLADHPSHIGLIDTHAYLYGDGMRYGDPDATDQAYHPSRYGLVEGGGGLDGEAIWNELIAPSTNVRLVTSGHVPDSFTVVSDEATNGTLVTELLADYQLGTVCNADDYDGRGYLEVLEMREERDGFDVRVLSYSPWEDAFRSDRTASFFLSAPGVSD